MMKVSFGVFGSWLFGVSGCFSQSIASQCGFRLWPMVLSWRFICSPLRDTRRGILEHFYSVTMDVQVSKKRGSLFGAPVRIIVCWCLCWPIYGSSPYTTQIQSTYSSPGVDQFERGSARWSGAGRDA